MKRLMIDKKQQLISQTELKSVLKIAGLDYWENIKNRKFPSLIFDQQRRIIKSVVLNSYLEIDNIFDMLISNYFFHHFRNSSEEVEKITKSEEFTIFQSCILGELFYLKKFNIVQKFINIPKKIKSNIIKINDLRNVLTHSYIPEKFYSDRIIYNGKLIFSAEGVKLFDSDVSDISKYFHVFFEKAFDENDIIMKK